MPQWQPSPALEAARAAAAQAKASAGQAAAAAAAIEAQEAARPAAAASAPAFVPTNVGDPPYGEGQWDAVLGEVEIEEAVAGAPQPIHT